MNTKKIIKEASTFDLLVEIERRLESVNKLDQDQKAREVYFWKEQTMNETALSHIVELYNKLFK